MRRTEKSRNRQESRSEAIAGITRSTAENAGGVRSDGGEEPGGAAIGGGRGRRERCLAREPFLVSEGKGGDHKPGILGILGLLRGEPEPSPPEVKSLISFA